MRSSLAYVVSIAILAFGAIDASPCIAQTHVTSLEGLRRELAPGDVITVVPAVGQPVAGRLIRLGADDLDIRLSGGRSPKDRGPRDVTIPLDAIRSLERPRDSVRNGAAWGAGVGAGIGGTLFLAAAVTDRNEIDEWAPAYAAGTAICIGIGALIGWGIDAANSKPHIRFDSSPRGGPTVRLRPLRSRGYGVAVAVAVSF